MKNGAKKTVVPPRSGQQVGGQQMRGQQVLRQQMGFNMPPQEMPQGAPQTQQSQQYYDVQQPQPVIPQQRQQQPQPIAQQPQPVIQQPQPTVAQPASQPEMEPLQQDTDEQDPAEIENKEVKKQKDDTPKDWLKPKIFKGSNLI